jgi:hypothetical protein
MSEVIARIAAWEADGLIDEATADRLRAAEGGSPAVPAPATEPTHQAGMFVGPGITIPEVFGYLGMAFLLAGWTAWTMRGSFGSDGLGPKVGPLLAAAVLIGLGLVLRRRDARSSRAAGVAFLVALGYISVGALAILGPTQLTPEQTGLIAAIVAAAVAIILRLIHPAVLTQIGLLSAATGLAATTLIWFQAKFLPTPRLEFDASGLPITTPGGTDPMVLLVASAIWWLCVAVVIGLIGLRESKIAERGDDDAARRAAVTRLWAGLVAVIGLDLAVTRSDFDPLTGQSAHVLTPWIGELALIGLALVLLERAFRRDSTAYVYAAALGLIMALTDFNVSYLTDSTELGLAVEGAILLAVGLGADRLRRRIGRGRAGPTAPVDDIGSSIEDVPRTTDARNPADPISSP